MELNRPPAKHLPAQLGRAIGVTTSHFSGFVRRAIWPNYGAQGSILFGLLVFTFTLCIAVKASGGVAAWGYNAWGQCDVPANLGPVSAIAAGGGQSLALKTDGTVIAWGYNAAGQASVPAGLSNVIAIGRGFSHSLAVKSDGTVVAWGENQYGQASVPPGLSSVVAVAGGEYHSLALRSDGTVIGWGQNGYGQVNIPAGLTGVIAVAAMGSHSMALKSNGTVVAWGFNGNGVGTTGGQTDVPAGLNGVVAIASGFWHCLALKSDGTVVAWGWNHQGQIDVPQGLTGVTAIAAGSDHSVALKNDGTVVAWGRNSEGQCTIPLDISRISAIAAGGYHTLAIQPEVEGVIFDAAAQFSATDNSDTSTWSYRYRQGLIRDGNYPLLPTIGPTVYPWSPTTPVSWTLHGDIPALSVNQTAGNLLLGGNASVVWPKDTMFVHPGPDGLVLLSWRSPFSGLVDIHASFRDIDAQGGDGIGWSVERNNGGDTLQVGTISNGAPVSFLNLFNVPVTVGDRINFIINPGPSIFVDSDSSLLSAQIVDRRGEIQYANGGPDQNVRGGAIVNLNGTASSQLGGFPLTYHWTQLRTSALEPVVILSAASTPTATFVAPYPVSGPLLLTFQLDITGGGTTWSDTVNVVVGAIPPIADAGVDQTVYEGGAVTLDGTGSYHPDGIAISYAWRQVGISSASPAIQFASLPNQSQFSFVAPSVSAAGATLTFELTVTAEGFSTTDTVVATILNDPLYTDPLIHPLSNWKWRATAPFLQTAVAYGNGRFVVVGLGDTIRYSDGGSDWQSVASPVAARLEGIAFGNGEFVAIGALWNDGRSPAVIRSPDGVHWTTSPVPLDFTPFAVTFLKNEFVIQSKANRGRELLRSTDGTSWQAGSLPFAVNTGLFLENGFDIDYDTTEGAIWRLSYGEGVYVAVGYEAKTYWSNDLITWTEGALEAMPAKWEIFPNTRSTLWTVHYANGCFVAAGSGGAILNSSDGKAWTVRVLIDPNFVRNGYDFQGPLGFSGSTWLDGNFIVVGRHGVFRSVDGITWLPASLVIEGDEVYFLRSVTAGRGSAIAVGSDETWQSGPGIEGFSPATISGGGPTFPLTVRGSSFEDGCTVRWNGLSRPTTFLSDTTLIAQIAAGDIPSTADLTTVGITVENTDGIDSLAKSFVVTAADVTTVQSKIAGAGETVSISTAPSLTSGTSSGIDATLLNSGVGASVTISAANYSDNPAPNTAFDVAGSYLDLKVTGADAADELAANFYYPLGVTESDAIPLLKYFNGSAWTDVRSSGGKAPTKNTTDNLDSTVSGGRFEVYFDQTSSPKITELHGTFFGIAQEPLTFEGFLVPIAGADATGGSFISPLRTFKAGSTIPVKFKTSRAGAAVTSGQHRLQLIKYSNETTAANPIDATPQEAATTGNQFVLKGGEWHLNLDTKASGLTKGVWKVVASLSDGTTHSVWIQIK